MPLSDPKWSSDTEDADNWDRNRFITNIVERLRRVCTKPLNYSKLSDVTGEIRKALCLSGPAVGGVKETYAHGPRVSGGPSQS